MSMEESVMRKGIFTGIWTSGVVGAVVFIYYLAYLSNAPFDATNAGVVYFTSGLSVCITCTFIIAIAQFVFLGVKERHDGLISSPFYRVELLERIAIFAITAPGGLRGLDRIYHHGRIEWMFLISPGVIILAIVFYLGVFACCVWKSTLWVATSNPLVNRHRAVVRSLLMSLIIIAGVIAFLCIIYRLGR